MPLTILEVGGSHLYCTTEDYLQGFVTDEYGNPHLVRMSILIVSGIGNELYSAKAAAR